MICVNVFNANATEEQNVFYSQNGYIFSKSSVF